ncbi:ead/Ea22-like family protein [Enterobacter sp. EGD-HP1]|uniref:ead/Ea22-like family protein n=1 Tax=Enterobacter sp. EGD-HP1 TaxID=1357268 RepID=UPI0004DB42EA|nr:ead/Ea22-like family protein [Enterobacter sp. EGD-HP1]KFA86530.1 hypothetical protein N037_03195 [Enterobacter sp. EGD-HP1]
MSNIDKRALREAADAANKSSWGRWESYHPHKGARGYEVKVGVRAVAQHCLKVDAAFIAVANPAAVLALLDELEAAEKRIAELEAVKCKLSDSKLLSLAKDIVENLVDTGGSDPEYTQQYVGWTCKRIRTAAGKGE